MATYFRSDGWVKAALGPAIAGAQIYVCTQPCNVFPPITPPRTTPIPWLGPNPQANIYSDNGITPIVQPIITDGFGHYDFYALPGQYTVVVMYGGKVQQYYVDQSIGNAGSSLVLSTNNTPNFNQTSLNFVQGAGITLATDNYGNMTITGTSITYPGDATKFLNGTGVFSVPYTPPIFGTAGQGGFFSAGFSTIPYGLVANQGMNLVNNQVSVWQFENPITRVIRKITATNSADVNGTCNFGIYSAAGALLLDSGPFNAFEGTPTTQSRTVTAVTLPPGVYYFAQSATNTSVQFYGFTSVSNPGTQAYSLLNRNAARAGYAANSMSGTSLPATLGTITAADPTGNIDMVGVFFEP